MAEQLLYDSQVGATIEHVGRARVPQDVRRQVTFEADSLTGAQINEASLVAKNTMAWSTYLNAMAYDFDDFRREFDRIADHVRAQMMQAPAPA